MKRLAFTALLPLAALAHAGTATFDDLAFTGGASYENGSHLGGAYTTGGVSLGNAYNPTYGSWSGFAYSKVQDTTTAGYGNQYAAYAGGAYSGTNYGVSYASGARMTLPTSTQILGMEVTNTTYAALSMLNGDPFAKKFSSGDFLILTATGYANGAVTGTSSIALADYRFSDPARDYVLKDWTYFDLSSLGYATSVAFSYASSDVGQFGINTPTYFALDDVRIQATPEPATFAALGLGLVAVVRRRRGGVK